jgi:hypothetical protein
MGAGCFYGTLPPSAKAGKVENTDVVKCRLAAWKSGYNRIRIRIEAQSNEN